MKTGILKSVVAVAILLGSVGSSIAEDKTINGMATCAKDHTTVIKVRDGDQTVAYQLTENEVSKKFHGRICRRAAAVKATGEVKEEEGKLRFTAKRIELASK